jgi:hypothetical protein
MLLECSRIVLNIEKTATTPLRVVLMVRRVMRVGGRWFNCRLTVAKCNKP